MVGICLAAGLGHGSREMYHGAAHHPFGQTYMPPPPKCSTIHRPWRAHANPHSSMAKPAPPACRSANACTAWTVQLVEHRARNRKDPPPSAHLMAARPTCGAVPARRRCARKRRLVDAIGQNPAGRTSRSSTPAPPTAPRHLAGFGFPELCRRPADAVRGPRALPTLLLRHPRAPSRCCAHGGGCRPGAADRHVALPSVFRLQGGGRSMIEPTKPARPLPVPKLTPGPGAKHIPDPAACTGATRRRPVFIPSGGQLCARACWCSSRCTWTCCPARQGRRPCTTRWPPTTPAPTRQSSG